MDSNRLTELTRRPLHVPHAVPSTSDVADAVTSAAIGLLFGFLLGVAVLIERVRM